MSPTKLAFALPLLWAVACADATPPVVDGTPDAGLVDAFTVPRPTPPALASVEPCPSGWTLTSSLGTSFCRPWATGGGQGCRGDQAHFPSEAGCTLIGTACGVGDYATDLPAGSIRYVKAGATGGDGTEALPFGTINEALAAAPAGTTIAIGKGDYDEIISVPTGVTLHGACVAETTLRSTSPDDEAGAIELQAPDVALRNLTISALRPGVRVRGATTTATIEDVVVDGASGMGIRVTENASVTSRNLVVRNMLPRASDGNMGRGLQVATGSVMTVQRLVVHRARSIGLLVGVGAVLDVTDAAISSTQPNGAGLPSGRGGHIQDGAQLILRRSVIEDSGGGGLVLLAASARVEDSLIRGTRPRANDDTQGFGIFADDGSSLELRRTVVDQNRSVAVLVQGVGSHLTASDLIVRSTRPQKNGLGFGRGLIVQFSASADVARVLSEHNHEGGLEVGESGTATITDAVVRDIKPAADDQRAGRGVDVVTGAAADITRLHVLRTHAVGIYVTRDSVLRLSDFHVEDTRERACLPRCIGGLGIGLAVVDEGRVFAERGLITNNALAGIQIAAAAGLDLTVAEVSFNRIGANIQVPNYDLDRVSRDVVYVGNDTNLDAADLPLPDASNPLR